MNIGAGMGSQLAPPRRGPGKTRCIERLLWISKVSSEIRDLFKMPYTTSLRQIPPSGFTVSLKNLGYVGS